MSLYSTIRCTALIAAIISILTNCSSGNAGQKDYVCDNCTPDTVCNNGIIGMLDTTGNTGKPIMEIYKSNNDGNGSYILTIFHNEHSGDGVYSIQSINTDNSVEIITGKRYTLRGTDDATIWRCENKTNDLYFLIPSSSEKDTIYRIPDESTLTRSNPLHLISR